jgi:hypothetical protein
VICLKATSKVELFMNNAEKMVGAVFIGQGECDCFDVDTIIEPDNQIPLSYEKVASAYRMNTLERLGELPDGFDGNLIKAVKKSETMYEMQQKRLLMLLKRKVS